jgi:hypothetical protein
MEDSPPKERIFLHFSNFNDIQIIMYTFELVLNFYMCKFQTGNWSAKIEC